MIRKIITLVALAALAPAAPAVAASKLSQDRAMTAIEKQVKRQYSARIQGRLVMADECERLSARRVRCTYGVYKNTNDGYEEGVNGEDSASPYKYTGIGTATLTSSGTVVARVSRPAVD